MDQRTAIGASLGKKKRRSPWPLGVSEAQRITHLVASLNDLLVLHALDLDVHRDPESTDLLRLAEVDLGVNHRVLDGVALAHAPGHQLERAQETRCHRGMSNRHQEQGAGERDAQA